MQTHGVGCYTSQAAMKKFNRTNELLADAAERASVAADWLAALPYPGERLREAWTRVLWHQFHDDLTGTCIPQAYQFSWNDELISLNQFAGVLTSATSAVASRPRHAARRRPARRLQPAVDRAARSRRSDGRVSRRGAGRDSGRRLGDRARRARADSRARRAARARILFLA